MVKLVIVESPAKCSKIQGFLGDGYIVKATKGHIRTLVEKLEAVGIDRNWEPLYQEMASKKDAISALRAAARTADEVLIMSDCDFEGEAIGYHICHILKLNPSTTKRLIATEITKPAITHAITHPVLLDLNKVYAQQARAMLDLMIGYTISPVLWKRVAPRLSAGRCQTPALRLVCERDAEVDTHVASASWRLSGDLGGLTIDANDMLDTQEAASAVLKTLHSNPSVTVVSVKESVSVNGAPKPLITSTLQQEASALHGLAPKITMSAAQKLYENGHITYMRTDNPMLSAEAAADIRRLIVSQHGAEFVGSEGQHTVGAGASVAGSAGTGAGSAATKKKSAKKGKDEPEAQAAHEAIRPTHPENTAPVDDPTQLTVYRLIWRRALQSQMAAAQTHVRKATVTLDADPARQWTAEQTKGAFAGWRVLERQDPVRVAAEQAAWTTWSTRLVAGNKLSWTVLRADQVFTKPKGRYTEATLIAELERRGIGRPSTFASLVTTIMDRNYVEKTNTEGKTQDSLHLSVTPRVWPPTVKTESHKVGGDKNKLKATALGKSVADFLYKEYNDLFGYDFTAKMEAQLDAIAHGTTAWKTLLQTTWDTYKDRYAAVMAGGGSRGDVGGGRERDLGDSVKVILCSKGPLFVKEGVAAAAPTGGKSKKGKATFAPLLADMDFASVTAEDAVRAFAAAAAATAGELLGTHDGHEIRRKRGRFGLYAEWNGINVSLKGGETLEQIQEKLVAKASVAGDGESGGAYTRKLGDFTIKKGPYGYYFFKHTLKRVTFVKFPAGLDPEKVNVVDMAAMYSDGLAAKKRTAGGKFGKKKEAE